MKLVPQVVSTIVAAVGLLGAAERSDAAVIFSIGAPAAIDLSPNQQVELPVFVEFTGEQRAALIADGGLYVAGARLARTGAGGSFIADANVDESVFDGMFSYAELIGTAPHAEALLLGEIFDGDTFGEDNGSVSRFSLGTFTITAGAQAGTNDTFVLGIIDPDTDNVISNAVAFAQRDPVAFDDLVQPVTVSINIVPEPGFMLPVLGGMLALRRRGRR